LDFFGFVTSKKKCKKVKENTITTNKNTTKLFSIINFHYQPPPLTNEEEDTTLSTIPRNVLLKLKKMVVHREFAYQKKIIFALRNIEYNESSR